MLEEIEIDDADAGDDEDESWYSRAKSGIRTFASVAIFLASLGLLYWNEGYSKRHSDAIAEVGKQVVEAPLDAINPALEGKPVHLSARVISQSGTQDDFFGLRTQGVGLYREVEIFQWIEYEETSGKRGRKRTEYVYAMDWDTTYHDSSKFHEPRGHENPKPTLESDGFFAGDARFGPYRFDNDEVAARSLRQMDRPNVVGSLGRWPTELTSLPELSSTLQQKRWYKIDEGTYYRGNKASDVYELGDLNVTFYELSNDFPLTMIGAQKGDHLESWKASNGDSVLLAAGGARSAELIINDAVQQGANQTRLVRIAGLIGAVIGAAGIGKLLGGFLSMIPVVGSIVQLSLMVSGAIFGLLVGLITIVLGWMSARPWISGVIMALIIGAILWAVGKGRSAEGRKKRFGKVAKIAAAAKQRALERLSMSAAPMALATAGVGGMPPPPPAGRTPPSRFVGKPSTAPMPPIDSDPSKDLAPLEWTPGLAPTAPPAVKQQSNPLNPPRVVDAPPPKVPAKRTPNPFDSEDDADIGIAQFESRPPLAPPPVNAPARPAAPSGPHASTASSRAPLFDTVEPRAPVAPLFDTVEVRAPAAPLFDTVERRAPAAPLFDTVEPRAPAAPLFDTVEVRAPTTPLFDAIEPFSKPKPLFDDEPPATRSAPRVDASAAQDARSSAPPAPTVAPAALTRVSLGAKGDYALNKIVRRALDGSEELLCYELMHQGKPIKRGTQEQIKLAFKEALARS